MNRGRRAAVRWVLQLVDQRAGPRAASDGGGGAIDWPIDWAHVIAFSSAHMILPALAPRLARAGIVAPDEVTEFLADMHSANRARNETLRTALEAIGAALGGLGEPAVVLKGGAFLLEKRVGWDERFMSDLDLLVGARDLDEAIRRLSGLGFVMIESPYDPGRDAHAPPLVSPCGAFTVEVHTRLFGRDDFGLPVERVRRGAKAAGSGLLVPAADVRLAHAIAHAQLHNFQAVVGRIILRDIVDLARFAEVTPINAGRLDRVFAQPRARDAAGALVAAAEMLTGISGYEPTAAERAWAECAVRRLESPAWRRIVAAPGDLLRLEGHRLAHERGHVARRLGALRDPARLAHGARAWTYKQRQRLWA